MFHQQIVARPLIKRIQLIQFGLVPAIIITIYILQNLLNPLLFLCYFNEGQVVTVHFSIFSRDSIDDCEHTVERRTALP